LRVSLFAVLVVVGIIQPLLTMNMYVRQKELFSALLNDEFEVWSFDRWMNRPLLYNFRNNPQIIMGMSSVFPL
jgi:hypothetical protein